MKRRAKRPAIRVREQRDRLAFKHMDKAWSDIEEGLGWIENGLAGLGRSKQLGDQFSKDSFRKVAQARSQIQDVANKLFLHLRDIKQSGDWD